MNLLFPIPTAAQMHDAIKQTFKFTEMNNAWFDCVFFNKGHFEHAQGVVQWDHTIIRDDYDIKTVTMFAKWTYDGQNITISVLKVITNNPQEVEREFNKFDSYRKLWDQ